MEQLLAMYVAATLTEAACGSSGGTNNISPDLSDPQVRAKNLQAWETFRAYYQAVIQALADPQDWPVPQVQVGGFLRRPERQRRHQGQMKNSVASFFKSKIQQMSRSGRRRARGLRQVSRRRAQRAGFLL